MTTKKDPKAFRRDLTEIRALFRGLTAPETARYQLGLYGGFGPSGYWILRVVSGSPAERLGLKPGDCISHIKDVAVDCQAN